MAGQRSARLEIYCNTTEDAGLLHDQFGGRIARLDEKSWLPPPPTPPGRPLSIGGRLLVTGRREELADLRATRHERAVICIPAAMAFGTGDHATTAMCLRLLEQVSRRRSAATWDLLDLGTGSGILALAGKRFGAREAHGLDNDPHAVRTARENARLNGLAARSVRFVRADLTRWRPEGEQTWGVVTANLFSGLLIRLLPAVIAPVVAPGGDLILSGVLATQADEVVAAILAAGFSLTTTKARGRWRAFHCWRR